MISNSLASWDIVARSATLRKLHAHLVLLITISNIALMITLHTSTAALTRVADGRQQAMATSEANAKQMAGSKCVTDPVQSSLQNCVSEFFYNCYARKRWEVLKDYVDSESFISHTDEWTMKGAEKVVSGLAAYQAFLAKETEGVESMTVECMGFAPVTDDDLKAIDLQERGLLCKATASLTVKRAGGGETLEHKTHIWRGTEGEVRICESWIAADDDDEGW